ncbi:hypothetical protein DBR42_04600 [Pelomonas sp. HMWF004]|nr:hypothetical protein DBR42_04600 [Pelomonas sp. HMWF004]
MLSYADLLALSHAPDEAALNARLVAAVAELGFGLSAGSLIRGRLASGRAAVHSFGNPPVGFIEASRSLNVGLRDPLLTSLLARPGCVTYDQDFYVKGGAAEMWDNQEPFGYREGMAISLHEPGHAEVFSFGVDSHAPLPTDLKSRRQLEGSLRVIGLHVQTALLRLHTPVPAPDLDALNPGEVRALQWAADGQAYWLRGEQLVVSNPGLVHAQRSAVGKLGERNGLAAVLRAIDGGLIEKP